MPQDLGKNIQFIAINHYISLNYDFSTGKIKKSYKFFEFFYFQVWAENQFPKSQCLKRERLVIPDVNNHPGGRLAGPK